MVLARPFINPNLMSIMKFTTGGPDEFVDRDLLPEVCLNIKFVLSLIRLRTLEIP